MANANGKDHGSHDVGKGSGREHEASSWDEWSEQESEDFTDVATLRVLEDLEAVAEWMLTCGYGTFRPFHVPFADDAPDGIGQAIRRLNAFTFRDFCPDALPMDQVMAQLNADGFEDFPSGDVEPGTLSEAVMVLADSLLDRDRDVFERRLCVEEPDALRAIGADWNISGERVRQIEHDLRARLAGAFERFHVEERLKDLAPEGVPYMPLDMMGERMPELLETVAGLDVPLHVVIDNYYGKGFSMQIADGWVGMPNLKSARNWWRAVLERRATPYGAVPAGLMDRYDLRDKDGQPTGAVRRWSRHCGVREYQGHYLTHSDPSRMAVAILSIEGHPMSIEELAASIQVGGDINDLETNLRLQPDLVRVNGQDWALKEWIGQPEHQDTEVSAERDDAPAGVADARTVGHAETPRDTAASGPDGDQPDDPVLRAIVEAGVKYRDMRDRHGSLWLFGGPELQPLTDRLKRMGVRFHYKPDGGRTTQGSPGWWSNDHWENGR